MNRLLFVVIFIIACLNELLPQVIIVTDKEENKPVADVAVFNQSKSVLVYTNASGRAELSEFPDNEVICFQHFSYERNCLSYADIRSTGFTISLEKKLFSVGEFVVSASRWEQDRKEVPNKIVSIESPVLNLREPQTAADLLAASDEVFVQKSQLGGGSPMIRGFATNRILIVVDGVRLNNAIYREGNIQNVISLDPLMTESAEIIFGPGTIVYGSDAIGGVMDFHTKKALLSPGEKIYLRTEAATRYSTANNEKTAHLSFSAGGKKIALLTGITWSDYDDLKMGSRKHPGYLRKEYVVNNGGIDSIYANSNPRVQVYSGYNQVNTTNKLRIKLSDNALIDIASHYSRLADVPRYDRLIQYKSGKLRYGDWYYGPQVWMMHSIQATLSAKKGVYDEARMIAAFQGYKESRHDRSFGQASINEQFEKLKIFSFNADFEKGISADKGVLFYGLEYVMNDINSTARIRDFLTGDIIPSGTRYPNGKNIFRGISGYTSFKYNLSGKTTFSAGLRYNFVSLNSTIADNSYYNFPFTEISIANSAVTGSTGMVWRPGGKLQVNLNLSTGFRAPNLDDAGKVFDSAPGIVVVPNPGLKPEYATNIDLGISKDFGSFIHMEITGFYTWLTNAMVRHSFLFIGEDSILYGGELSKVEAVVNAGFARVYGFSAGMQLNILKRLHLKSTLNVTEGHERGDIPLRHATPLFGSTHILYESTVFKADLYMVYNGPKKFKDMPPSEVSKPYMYETDQDGNPWSPGWLTLNFKTSTGIFKWATLKAGIENIFDVRYRPFASGIVSPGRNFTLSLRIRI
jgi:hemoglobin/transferrin/lactoferrin receptor protein